MAPETPRRRWWWIRFRVNDGACRTPLDSSIVYTALPLIAREFRVPFTDSMDGYDRAGVGEPRYRLNRRKLAC
jgi:hypothetical protein